MARYLLASLQITSKYDRLSAAFARNSPSYPSRSSPPLCPFSLLPIAPGSILYFPSSTSPILPSLLHSPPLFSHPSETHPRRVLPFLYPIISGPTPFPNPPSHTLPSSARDPLSLQPFLSLMYSDPLLSPSSYFPDPLLLSFPFLLYLSFRVSPSYYSSYPFSPLIPLHHLPIPTHPPPPYHSFTPSPTSPLLPHFFTLLSLSPFFHLSLPRVLRSSFSSNPIPNSPPLPLFSP